MMELSTPDCCWVDMYAPLHAQAREQALHEDMRVTSESDSNTEDEADRCIEVPMADTAPERGRQAFTCVPCGLTFKNKEKRIMHERRKHTGEKPFVCRYGCGAAFVCASDCGRHENKHIGLRPHACTYAGCGKRFASKQQLNTHVMRLHTFEKPWGCLMCDKRFTTKGQLTEHTRWHTGEKPYVCDHAGCGKRFTTRSELTIHARDHLDVKPFPCRHDGCTRSFLTGYARTCHERRVHALFKK